MDVSMNLPVGAWGAVERLHAFGKLTPVEKYLYTSHYIKEDLPKCGGDYTRRILFQLSEQITEALQNLRE